MNRFYATHNSVTSFENSILDEVQREKGSAAKDGAALDARRRKRFNTHDYYETDPSDSRSLGVMNRTERRLNNRNPQTRRCSSRLKCGDGSIDCGIRPVHCREQENHSNAENDKDGQNS
jgi:hypothetical protein